MGTCSCMDHPKESNDTLLVLAANSDSPASIAFKLFENVMIPEVKVLYKSFLLHKSSSIHSIDIKNKQISTENSELISKILPELPEIKEFVLINNELGFEGANKLADNLSCLRNLEKIIISNNKIDDEGIDFISQTVAFMPNLKEINFSNNEFSNIGAEKLEEVLSGLDNIEILDISGNNLNKKVLIKIAKSIQSNKSLKKFVFENSTLTASDNNSIKSILPNISFTNFEENY